MNSHPNEGLLGSLLIYVSAVFGMLALLGLPIYYAIQPTVVENAGAERLHELLSARRTDSAFPVARLAEADIFSPAVVTELQARAKEAETKEATKEATKETKEMQAERVDQRRARVAERASRSREVHHARAQVRPSVSHSFARVAPRSPSPAAY